ncbi:unnamed protein product [Prorocentrum cordatum]|uniref:Uncharacterized protein n=1 Tax=Prorocentrum cordatum TaxID=2364126 RepID=A0ABN9SWX8_9DINO|nr:unnamed protein product [Polarella glacialis]
MACLGQARARRAAFPAGHAPRKAENSDGPCWVSSVYSQLLSHEAVTQEEEGEGEEEEDKEEDQGGEAEGSGKASTSHLLARRGHVSQMASPTPFPHGGGWHCSPPM